MCTAAVLVKANKVASATFVLFLQDDSIGYLIQDMKSTGSAANNMTQFGPLATILWGYSISLCMSNGLSEEGGRGLGTMGWHPQLAMSMLKDAGFTRVRQLDWESDVNLFYLAQL